jgi:hypothetical protein
MTSRSAEAPGPGSARDLKPIVYVGTAWATMGLAGWWPALEADYPGDKSRADALHTRPLSAGSLDKRHVDHQNQPGAYGFTAAEDPKR